MKTLLLAAVLWAAFFTPAFGQDAELHPEQIIVGCITDSTVVEKFRTSDAFELIAGGVDNRNAFWGVFQHTDGSWQMAILIGDQKICFPATGDYWRNKAPD